MRPSKLERSLANARREEVERCHEYLRKHVKVAVFVLALLLGAATPRVSLCGNVTCVAVVQEAGRVSRENKGRVPAVGELARRLGAPAAVVERCMHAFGRRLRREGAESREASQALLEQLEEEEVEESFPEDLEEPGAVERPKREPKPRYLSIRPTPGAQEGADLLPGEWERHEEELRRERQP